MSAYKPLTVSQDIRTQRLVATAQAIQMARLIPKESASVLLANAKAIRLAMQGQEPLVVKAAAQNIRDMLNESGADIDPALSGRIRDQVAQVEKVSPAPAHAPSPRKN